MVGTRLWLPDLLHRDCSGEEANISVEASLLSGALPRALV